MIKCEEVLRRLNEYIDKELDETVTNEIMEHLKLCKYCCRHHDFEVKLKEMIQKSCFDKKAPEFLKNKISEMLGE